MLLQGCRAPQDVFAVMCLWFPNETDLNKAEAGETWVLTQAPLPTSDPLPELPISPPAEPGWPILRPAPSVPRLGGVCRPGCVRDGPFEDTRLEGRSVIVLLYCKTLEPGSIWC